MPEKTYLDANGNPVAAPKTYLDDNGNPVSQGNTAPVEKPGLLSSILSGTSPLHQAIDKAMQTEPMDTSSVGGFAKSAANNLGAGAVRVFSPLAHPIDAVGSMAKTAAAGLSMNPQAMGEAFRPAVEQVVKNPGGESIAAIPQAALMAAGAGEAKPLENPTGINASEAVSAGAGKAAKAVGQTAQDAGTGLINKTVGTLKNDFKRGANPARGYLESGNGPSLSMHSLAEKGEAALEDVGSQLGDAYKAATASGKKIPVDVVAQEMAKPIQKAIDLETGPGGTGNLAAIKSYVDQFAPSFEKAAQNGGFTPSELFKMKRSIAENTNWSDPAQFSLKSVRQQQTGALSGILSDAVPETADLNQMYQDLTKFTNRAKERANTGSRPLTAHIYKAGMTAAGALAGGMEGNALMGAAAGALMDSVPVKTTLGAGLFRGGKALSALGDRLAPAESLPVEGVAPNGLRNNAQAYKPQNPQGAPPPPNNNPIASPMQLRDAAIQRFRAAQAQPIRLPAPEITSPAPEPPSGVKGIMQKYEAHGVDSWVSDNGKDITINKVVVPKDQRGQGIGTAFMNDLTQYADATGKRLTLTPSADFGGSAGRLREFYKRFGFVENKGRNKDFTTRETMYRDPQK